MKKSWKSCTRMKTGIKSYIVIINATTLLEVTTVHASQDFNSMKIIIHAQVSRNCYCFLYQGHFNPDPDARINGSSEGIESRISPPCHVASTSPKVKLEDSFLLSRSMSRNIFYRGLRRDHDVRLSESIFQTCRL